MGTILFNWEQGQGLGHMMQMQAPARALVTRGHKVYVALRDVAGAEAAFAGSGVCYVAAPHDNPAGRTPPFAVTHSFAHVLANIGWHDGRRLFALTCAWANLYALVRPDVGLFDHAPTALLAARGLPMRKVVIGSGFCVPPDVSPWPIFRPEREGGAEAQRAAADEATLLARANRLLAHWVRTPLERLGQLYSEVDETFLTTLPELEQYPARGKARYWGPVLPEGGAEPKWPQASGKKVFAYCKRFDGLEPLAGMLRDSGYRTVLYVDGLTEAERRKMEGPTLHVESRRVDLRLAAAECDAAVLHAGQGATAAVLLAGKPILQIPVVLEQRLTAEATARLGAGLVVNDRAKDPAAALRKLDELLAEPRYAEAARRFARRYESFDRAQQVERMVARVEELIAEKGRREPRQTRRQAERRAKVFAG